MIYLYLLQHRTNLDNLPQDKKWSFYDLVTNWPAILPVTRKMHLNPAHLSGWLQRLTGSQQVTARCGCGISGSEFWMSERWCRTNPSVRPVCWPAGISGPSFGCSIVVLTPSRRQRLRDQPLCGSAFPRVAAAFATGLTLLEHWTVYKITRKWIRLNLSLKRYYF